MKLNLKLTNNRLFKLAVFGVISIGFFNSCDRDSQIQNDPLPEVDAQLTFTVDGIVDEVEINSNDGKASAAHTSRSAASADGIIESKDVSYEAFDAIVRLQNDPIDPKSKRVSNGQSSKASNAGSKAVAMAPRIKYRLLLYKDGALVNSVHAESGVATHVEVNKNIDYQWYAYSYNTEDFIPDVTSTTNPVVESSIDKPLLYASGTVRVTGTGYVDKPMLLQFGHRTSRIGAEISARGMFAGLESITATFAGTDYVKKGTLDLLTGQYISTTAVNVGNLNFKQLSPETKDTIKVAYYYTAAQTAIAPMKVNVSTFTVKLDKGSTRTFGTPISYSMNMNNLAWGNRVTSALDLIESALTVQGVRWSRALLYFSYADKAYRFRHLIGVNDYPVSPEEYWDYKSPFPPGPLNTQDPCTRVYPLNKWRMPTEAEASDLVDLKGSSRQIYNDYIEYNATGTAAPYPSNKLRIIQRGFMTPIVNIVADQGINAYFWTDDPDTFLGGLLGGVESYMFSDFRNVNPFIFDFVWMHGFQSTVGGLENVRCVRK